MDVKLIEVLNSKEALEKVSEISLKAVHSFKLKKIIAAINIEVTTFQEMLDEKRKILFDGVIDGEQPNDQKMEAFNSEMQEVTESIISLDFDQIKLSWFAKTNGVIDDNTQWHEFSASSFQRLSWLIEDDVP